MTLRRTTKNPSNGSGWSQRRRPCQAKPKRGTQLPGGAAKDTMVPSTRPSPSTCYGWTDGSFRRSASMGWYITLDSSGASWSIAQGFKPLGSRQTPFDAELAGIHAALAWFRFNIIRHMVTRSDSQSAIARASHGSRPWTNSG
jgi:hypothetical protein